MKAHSSEQISVLSLNSWTEHHELTERAEQMAHSLLSMDPMVACLQEVASPAVKQILHARLSHRFHVISSEHSEPQFPLLAYLPFVMTGLFALSISCWVDPSSTQLEFNKAGPWTGWLLLTLPLLTCPPCLFFFARLLLAGTLSVDLMALTVLLRKPREAQEQGFRSVSRRVVQPFPDSLRAYPLPSSGFGGCCFYWIQHCFFRPGFMIIHATTTEGRELTVCNSHLVISEPGTLRNHGRIGQMEFLKQSLAEHSANSSMVVVCGDFNAPPDSPEVQALRDMGLTDGFSQHEPGFNTWDSKLNLNVPKGQLSEPNSRLDHVFTQGANGCTISLGQVTKTFDGVHTCGGVAMPIVSDHFGVLAQIELQH